MLQIPEYLKLSTLPSLLVFVMLLCCLRMVDWRCGTGVVFHLALLWNGNCSEAGLPTDSQSAMPATHLQWDYASESGSDSDTDRPDPDLVLDDLASRRFHSPSPAPPTNFAMPVSPLAVGKAPVGRGGPWPKVTMTPSGPPQQNVTFLRSENMKQRCDLHVPA